MIPNSCNYYQVIGALISISIGSRFQQPDLVFPPLFWNYFVTGKLLIDDIYSIDKSYKKLITNIWSDFKTMSDEDFNVILNSQIFKATHDIHILVFLILRVRYHFQNFQKIFDFFMEEKYIVFQPIK